MSMSCQVIVLNERSTARTYNFITALELIELDTATNKHIIVPEPSIATPCVCVCVCVCVCGVRVILVPEQVAEVEMSIGVAWLIVDRLTVEVFGMAGVIQRYPEIV